MSVCSNGEECRLINERRYNHHDKRRSDNVSTKETTSRPVFFRIFLLKEYYFELNIFYFGIFILLLFILFAKGIFDFHFLLLIHSRLILSLNDSP